MSPLAILTVTIGIEILTQTANSKPCLETRLFEETSFCL